MYEFPTEAQHKLEFNPNHGGNVVHTYKYDKATNRIILNEIKPVSMTRALELYAQDQTVSSNQLPRAITNTIFIMGSERDLVMMDEGKVTVKIWEDFLCEKFAITLEKWCELHNVQYDEDLPINTCLAIREAGLSPSDYQGKIPTSFLKKEN